MDADRIEKIARRLFAANAEGAPFEWLTGDLAPVSLEEAYAAQSRLHQLWAEAGVGIAGWKIAITSKAMQELCGIDQPCVGGVRAGTIVDGPATVSLSDYVRLGLEFELAATLGEDVPPGRMFDAEAAMAITADVAPAFELIEDRGADYTGFDAASLVADNTWNAGVVLGPKIAGWRDIDWTAQPVSLTYNGAVETAVAGEAMGNPFNALAAVLNNLSERGLAAKAGQVVITGSTVKTRFAAAGDRAHYAIGDVGAVELSVTA